MTPEKKRALDHALPCTGGALGGSKAGAMKPETKVQILPLPLWRCAPSGKLPYLSDLNLISEMGPAVPILQEDCLK